jgi:hypothetical protein
MTVAVRMLRVGLGALMLLIAVPLMVTGGGLWLLSEHRDHGAFTATLQRTNTGGRAIVVADVDALLRRDMPFARGGQTTLSVAARGPGGPLFLGLAKESDVRRYLAGTPHAEITRVRLARGPLPVDLTPAVAAPRPAVPTRPGDQRFWLRASTGLTRDGHVEDALVWSPSSVRGQRLAIVVMNADASAGVDVTLNARLTPAWVRPTAGGLTIGGTALFLLGLLCAAWPTRRRRHDPDQFPVVPAEQLATDTAHVDQLPSSSSSSDDAAVPRPRVRGTADPVTLPRRDGSGVPEPVTEPSAGAPRAAAEPDGGAPEPAVESQVTKETQPVAEDEAPQSARPEGPPLALPPVNLRLTWPALPGTRQKENAKG